jgi:hypothetical protein
MDSKQPDEAQAPSGAREGVKLLESERITALEVNQRVILETCKRIEDKQDRFCEVTQKNILEVTSLKIQTDRLNKESDALRLALAELVKTVNEIMLQVTKFSVAIPQMQDVSNRLTRLELDGASDKGESRGKKIVVGVLQSLFGAGVGAAAMKWLTR